MAKKRGKRAALPTGPIEAPTLPPIVPYAARWGTLPPNYPARLRPVQAMRTIDIGPSVKHCDVWQSSLDAVVTHRDGRADFISVRLSPRA